MRLFGSKKQKVDESQKKTILVASDIHGSLSSAKKIVEEFKNRGCSKLLILGDFLYHGPRNDFPDEYNPKEVAEILKSVSNSIIAVKGNCDAEVDEMVLGFPLSETAILEFQGKTIYCTHGQHNNAEKPFENLADGSVVLYGHSHNIKQTKVGGVNYINIGSCSLPKFETVKCYGVLDDEKIQIFDFANNIICSYKL